MYIGLMLLLCSSAALGAGLRRPRQNSESSGSQQQGGSSPLGSIPFQPSNFGSSFNMPETIINQGQSSIPGGAVGNQFSQGFGQGLGQFPGAQGGQSGGQQGGQSGGQSGGQTFFNRNPPQQQVFFANRNPPNPNEPIPIISYENIQPGDGTYRYSYETGDGIRKEETGEQRVVGEPPEAGTVAQGSYSYTDLEGNQIAVTYTADENGFRPNGAHLPTPPPIPQDIMAALERSAQAEAAQNNGVVSPAYHYFFRNFRRF